MNRKRTLISKKNEISELFTFNLGGVPQKVLIEGKKKTLPVVIVLHGGPGMPLPYCAGSRGLYQEMTSKCIMVYWDQLGCGINNHELDLSFNVDRFADMTVDLIREISKLFPSNKKIIYSTSWGSILSLKAADRVPDEIDGVVVWAQILKNAFQSEELQEALMKSSVPAKKKATLKAIFEQHRLTEAFRKEDMILIAGCIRKYTYGYTNKLGKQMKLSFMMKSLMGASDYSFKDKMACLQNGMTKNESIQSEVVKLDLCEELKRMRTSYTILQGDTDIVTSTQTVSQIVRESNNPYLSVEVIANTGHIPGVDGFTAILQTIDKMMNC